uniref:ENT domain-containing protein n=1 Tax=Mesocestoides corti TaxID=53468 RepID=A0A5K3FPJ6_MESCO
MFENIAASKHSAITWPLLVDYTKAQCKRVLRRLELEAYAKVVTVFRAQGPLTGEKKKTLEDLQQLLSIASDRHKAEVRRALNDEELATISESICGKETDENWVLEGRRVAPLLRRGVPQTAFLPKADAVANKWASINSKLPRPIETAVANITPPSIRPIVKEQDEFLQDTGAQHHGENSGVLKVEVATADENDEREVTSNSVPEAAVEVTCEADVSKLIQTPRKKDENAKSVSTAPLQDESHHRNFGSGHVLPVSAPPKISEANATQQNVSSSPSQGSLITPATGSKRPHPDSNPPNQVIVSSETIVQTSQPPPTTDTTASMSNGVIPLISSSRNVVIRQSVVPAPIPVSLHSSQSIQVAKVQSTGPMVTVSALNRVAPTTIASTTPGLTTMVVTGTAGAAAYVSQPVTAARIMKSYPSVLSYHHATTPTTHLSASSILADSKRQAQHQQTHPQHSIVVQQQIHSTGSTSGNVIVVHRGWLCVEYSS